MDAVIETNLRLQVRQSTARCNDTSELLFSTVWSPQVWVSGHRTKWRIQDSLNSSSSRSPRYFLIVSSMHLPEHELCTSKTELALELKFHVEIHRIYMAMVTNTGQWKWRQIRICSFNRSKNSPLNLSNHSTVWLWNLLRPVQSDVDTIREELGFKTHQTEQYEKLLQKERQKCKDLEHELQVSPARLRSHSPLFCHAVTSSWVSGYCTKWRIQGQPFWHRSSSRSLIVKTAKKSSILSLVT